MLKAGGIFINGTITMRFLDENFVPLPVAQPGAPGFSWLQYVVTNVHLAMVKGGSTYKDEDPVAPRMAILEKNPNFKSVHLEEHYIPLGPWKAGMTDRQVFASNLMRDCIARSLPAFRHSLLAQGLKADDVDHMIDEGVKELRELKVKIYLRFMSFGAIRKDGPFRERT